VVHSLNTIVPKWMVPLSVVKINWDTQHVFD